MAARFVDTDELRGATFHLADLGVAEIRDCDLTGARIVDCVLHDVYVGGDIRNLVVNDVDVTGYVGAELDRRHPERVLVRTAETPDEYRAALATLEQLWVETVERARRLPDEMLHERVDGEWSFTETHRHLLFAADAWVGSCVLEEDRPYHRLGYPAGGYPPEKAAAIGIELDAEPTFDEALAARTARQRIVRRLVDGLTEDELARPCTRKPSPEYPDADYVVGRCLKVVLREEAEHLRYAVRDLAELESRRAGD